MGANKDERQKLESHIASYNEHNHKSKIYALDHHKTFARKTMQNVYGRIEMSCKRLGCPVPKPCEVCGDIHEGSMHFCKAT